MTGVAIFWAAFVAGAGWTLADILIRWTVHKVCRPTYIWRL